MNLKPLESFKGTERQLLGIFGVDVGNYDTKSRHTNFVSGFKKMSIVNQLSKEYIEVDNAFYGIQDAPFNYVPDKTKNDDMFILTLISIARESFERKISISSGEEITLAIGMPPGMYNKKFVDAYTTYYRERADGIKFKYKGENFNFTIKHIVVSAQCWGAAVQYANLTKGLNDVCFVDIGGITIDKLVLRNGAIVEGSIQSYDEGVNKMFADIANSLKNETGIRFSPNDVKAALVGNSNVPDVHTKTIKEKAHGWTRNIFSRMITEGAEFRLIKVVTLGGGALLLNAEIDDVSTEFEFLDRLKITDNKANACGYETIAAKELYGIKTRVLNDFWAKYADEHIARAWM